MEVDAQWGAAGKITSDSGQKGAHGPRRAGRAPHDEHTGDAATQSNGGV
jgi:hypothetical protein